MDFLTADGESAFVTEEVSNLIKESIEIAIGPTAYVHEKVNHWTKRVVELVISQLTKLQKPFKYITTCVIMQKTGAGIHTASSCYWDSTSDGSVTVRWENKTMYCIVSVFGLSLWPRFMRSPFQMISIPNVTWHSSNIYLYELSWLDFVFASKWSMKTRCITCQSLLMRFI